MKKHANSNTVTKIFSMMLVILLFISCEKQEYIQNFDDVFDVSGIEALNQKIANAADLSNTLNGVDVKIPAGLENVTLDEMIDHYTKSVQLSTSEIDMLLKNDSKTYIDIVNRMGSLPPSVSKLKIDFSELKNSNLNQYLLVQKQETDNFYSDDYYSAILAMKYYIESMVIEPLNELKKAVITIPPGNPGSYVPPSEVPRFVLIVSNNNWDMWWAYWSDGTRTKHKGAAGSFPGY